MPSDLTVYRDTNANCVVMENENGTQFLNTLRATQSDGETTTVNIEDYTKNIKLVNNLPYDRFLDADGNAYGSNATDVIEALNSVFHVSGSPDSSNIPNITSATTVNVTQGDTINYELTADYGVGYEWENLPTGLVTVEGSVRKLVGGSGLTAGTYNVTAKAVNYYGQDTATISFVVASPPYANTKSVNFENNDYLSDTSPSAPLSRAGNGAGASDAWTIAMWFKPGTHNNSRQTILYFGDSGGTGVRLLYNGQNDKLELRYGSSYNNLELKTPNNSLTPSTWQHIMISYDGGTTGVSSGSVSSYYSRFEIWIDGVSQTTTNSHSNYGYSGSISNTYLRLGRDASGSHMRNSCRIDELAIWGSDQTSNVSSIYNSGTTHDLNLLTTAPDNWFKMGDGDTYPYINDVNTSDRFYMYFMTAADIVTDAP